MRKIDLRSDTVTLPTDEMLEAIKNAELGDDVYGEDPTVNALQEKAAKIMGMEESLLVCSGTMGNLCSTVAQTQRGDEIILEQNAHIFLHEVGSAAFIGGLQLRTIQGRDGYLITPEMLESSIRGIDIHYPRSTLVAIENTHNMAGGKVWTKEQTQQLIDSAKKNNIKIHIDGARIFNAAIALGIPPKELVKGADSLMFCLSKGLACPIGSLVVGSKDFIDKARRIRKMVGGGMRQAGIIAAPGIVALDKMINRLADDHRNARLLAKGIGEIDGIKVQDGQTNIIFIDIKGLGISSKQFKDDLAKNGIIVSSRWDTFFRLVTHYGIEKRDIDFLVNTLNNLYGKK